MCGIVAILDPHAPVARDTIHAIHNLRHRGADSTGVAGAREGRFGFSDKGRGDAQRVFGNIPLEEILDNMMVAHARYPTSEIGRNQYQPMTTTHPGLALVHNGQLANHDEVRMYLERRANHTFLSNSDSEVLTYALAEALLQEGGISHGKTHEEFAKENLFPALRALMDGSQPYSVEGAYAAAALIPQRGIVVFTDPHAIRPVRMLKKGDRIAFASETVALPKWEVIGDDIKPGTAIYVDLDGKIHEKQILDKGKKACIMEPTYLMRAHSLYDQRSIEQVRIELGAKGLSYVPEEIRRKIQLVMPVPRTPIPSAIRCATQLSLERGDIVEYGGVEALIQERIFMGRGQKSREERADDKFGINRHMVEQNPYVLVIDDCIVRGTNSKVFIRKLRDAGAKEVHFLSLFPEYRDICVAGVDTPTRDYLLMATMDGAESARAEIGADSLMFTPIKAYLQVLGLTEENACFGCTKGIQPFNVSGYAAVQERRRTEDS